MRACTSILLPFRQVSAWKMEDGGREEMAIVALDSTGGCAANERLEFEKAKKMSQILDTHPPPHSTTHTRSSTPSLGLCLGARGYCSQRIRI